MKSQFNFRHFATSKCINFILKSLALKTSSKTEYYLVRFGLILLQELVYDRVFLKKMQLVYFTVFYIEFHKVDLFN